MNTIDPTLIGCVLGLFFGIGIMLVLRALVRLGPGALAARIDPYLRRDRHSSLLGNSAPTGRFRVALIRLAGPVAEKSLSLLERLTGGAEQLERRLRLAGRSTSADAFRIEQVVFAAVGLGIGLGLGLAAVTLRGASPLLGLLLVAMCTVAGVLLRDHLLGVEIRRRASRMAREFPTVADLLALAVAAGESPIAAMERVARGSQGVLPSELARTVGEIRTGATTVHALTALGARSPLPAVARFSEGVAVAIERGTPLADVLRAQAQDARAAAKRDLMETAGKRENLMLVPVVFFVLPLVIVFAIFPGLAVLEIAL